MKNLVQIIVDAITIVSGIITIIMFITGTSSKKKNRVFPVLVIIVMIFVTASILLRLNGPEPPTGTSQPTTTTYAEDEPDYPDIDMDYIRDSDVTSSGYLEAENYGVSSSYYPFYVIDGDLHNAWLDNDANGFGYNEWVQIKFDQTYIVNGIQIYSGYHKNEEILHRNNRIKDIEIVFSDGSSLMQTLEDKPVGEYNIIELDESVATKSVKFIIKSVYPADYPYAVCWDDTGISEIILY